MSQKKPVTYKESGVDIKAGEELISSIKGMVKETHDARVLSNIGGFGGLYEPDLSSFSEPVFVSSVDGVGTKLIVAFKAGRYDTVGQDLVNHCINDIAVCGAIPLFFLDYFSTGKLDKEIGFDVISGFAKACRENGVALIGGETAEMPDIYKEGEFDLAGTIVGIVNKPDLIVGRRIKKGDRLIALPSSGLHTNGYSLARNVLFSQFSVDDVPKELGIPLSDALLAVHRSYLKPIQTLKSIDGVHGFSHITGGGIEGNTRRILPEGLSLQIDWDRWERPSLFDLIQTVGAVPEEDMRQTFNLGAGLVVVVSPDVVDSVQSTLKSMGESSFEIGMVK
ncbi:MAG: phosphoribosylformylglycinamidine cyclo-ligase [Bacteroidota bacterium]